jgi:hypothetical protein
MIEALICVKVLNAYTVWVTEQASVAVMLYTCVREVLGSYPTKRTAHPDLGFSWFYSVLLGKSQAMTTFF